jgi:hypothetical protein
MDAPDYDTICKVIGKLYLESQYRIAVLSQQANEALLENQRLQHLNGKLQEELASLNTNE